MSAARCWKVSPQDHTRGRGGFEGEWFSSSGITDAEFPTVEAAEAAIRRRFPKWTREDMPNMSGPVYRKPGAQKFLCIFPCY